MSDVDLIYGALLRAERKLSEEQDRAASANRFPLAESLAASLRALNFLRAEVGAELASQPLENRP